LTPQNTGKHQIDNQECKCSDTTHSSSSVHELVPGLRFFNFPIRTDVKRGPKERLAWDANCATVRPFSAMFIFKKLSLRNHWQICVFTLTIRDMEDCADEETADHAKL
ncbi:MAG TPA: hypothetical protein VKB49_22320, partial [Candidatus Sulfotelmatobacter sp.]|nr:hypothetical protein [Candidatus Sulfotelmatobacter sp.]